MITIEFTVEELFEHEIQDRYSFETQLYDFLISPIIPESFWEPVKIGYSDISSLEDIIGENECSICLETHLNFKKVHCCKQKICNGCCYKWFENSVKCPYCCQDLRECNLKKSM